MELNPAAKRLRVYLGEADRLKHTALHEVLIREARRAGLAGATAWRGILGFGPASRLRSERILDLSSDLPVVVEIVDEAEKIERFLPELRGLFDAAGCGGLTTIEDVRVIRYAHGKGGSVGEPAGSGDGRS